ncbi:hypothetical protein AMTR_s00073p00065320 [Amborella trichopoda]|uniref:Uncharacterized protein n=1 Tax=Amborella trichopoda TaxID=13333 RepID=W1NRI6_AMBTC|nr:hypothetical protein AMTR_s00073p00065320 [Amborella trichopoda]
MNRVKPDHCLRRASHKGWSKLRGEGEEESTKRDSVRIKEKRRKKKEERRRRGEYKKEKEGERGSKGK